MNRFILGVLISTPLLFGCVKEKLIEVDRDSISVEFESDYFVYNFDNQLTELKVKLSGAEKMPMLKFYSTDKTSVKIVSENEESVDIRIVYFDDPVFVGVLYFHNGVWQEGDQVQLINKPNMGLILFDKRTGNGTANIFQMKPDGKGLTALTSSTEYDETDPFINHFGTTYGYYKHKTTGYNSRSIVIYDYNDKTEIINSSLSSDLISADYGSNNDQFLLLNREGVSYINYSQDNSLSYYYNNTIENIYFPSSEEDHYGDKLYPHYYIDPLGFASSINVEEEVGVWNSCYNLLYLPKNTSRYDSQNLYSTCDPLRIEDCKISPDGKRVIFIEYDDALKLKADIMLTDLSTKQTINLSNYTPGSNMYATHPSFNSDGTKIVYALKTSPFGNHDLHIMNIDGSNNVNITNTLLEDEDNPTWN